MRSAARADNAASSSVRLAIGFTSLVVVSAIFIAGLTLFSASTIDRLTLERQIKSASRELSEIAERIPEAQVSLTSWDDAWEHTYPKFDADWIDVNIGRYMHSYFGFDDVRVVAPDNDVVFASAGDESLSPDQTMLAPFAAAIDALRAKLSGQSDIREVSVAGYFVVEGRIALASLAPIVPYTETTAVNAPPYIHITIRYLDMALEELRASHEFTGAIAPLARPTDGAMASIPLPDIAGKTIGYVAWVPTRPGTDLLWQIGPSAAIVAIVMLLVSIRLSRLLVRQSAELTAREAQARHLAFHDPLTGMANRALLGDRLDEALSTFAEGSVALHYLDLDRFKDINDTMGHAAGDTYLRHIAERLTRLLGPDDVAARFGGDEFVILQAGISGQADAAELAQSIVDAIRQPVHVGKDAIQLSTSIGIALSERGINAAELLRRADICLYRAKAGGRNGFMLFAPEMDEMVQHKRVLEIDLAAAMLQTDQLKLVFQPLYSQGGSKLDGAEALVRWMHPTRGAISPQLFIQIAEECGLIVPLGEWILRQACRQAASWDLGYIAVNVSPVQFRQPDFAALVQKVLEETGLPANRLELEITEGFLVDKARSSAALAALRAIGVRVALDDFGTGYSSLSYLRQFDVDKIKIDQSFVRQSADPSARSIIVAMVQLARALEMRVTAEGIETEEQKQFLSEIGCHQLQGYLLGRPETAEQFTHRLANAGRVAA